ncbi:hypothetical protein [Aquiflexum lacus]|uniref:hypothetical protein n=1 Tax=Aquiflexum lacus TaxID=2483805 RepID=UPI0018963AE9|nr:hypothetical protein [Aquiflexum lacus]
MKAYKRVFAIMIILLGTMEVSQAQEYVVEVEALDHSYDLEGSNVIPSGWITFVLNNRLSEEVHEISLVRLLEGISHEDYLGPYMKAWDILLQEYQEGKVERSGINERVNQMLPEWSDELEYVSARGLVSPGRSAARTMELAPGNYSMVCWMKTEDGQIHIMKGMSRALKAGSEKVNREEPQPDWEITLKENEIETDWQPSLGSHEFRLNLSKGEDGKLIHSNIHLIKIEKGQDLDEINSWMDWYQVGGLRAQTAVEFLGGLDVYSQSTKGYFTLEIKEPGEYAWIVFVPGKTGIYKRFAVSAFRVDKR